MHANPAAPASVPTDPAANLRRRANHWLKLGHPAPALECLAEAVRIQPDSAAIRNDLGNVLRLLGRTAEAILHYRLAVRLRPDVMDLHRNLAAVLAESGRPVAASGYPGRAVSGVVASVALAVQLGTGLLRLRLPEEAEACYRLALGFRADDFDTWNNLGTALWEQGRLDEAAACYERALEIRPDDPDVLTNLGNVHWKERRAAQAEDCYRRTLARRPACAEALMNLGLVLSAERRPDEALEKLREAARLRPDMPEAHDNLAAVLALHGQDEQALAAWEQAILVAPDYPEAHRNRAMLWLAQGDYERGWPEYQWRWRCKSKAAFAFTQPRWQGEDLTGRTILLHAEQGFGDTLQFVRYAALVKQRGATVFLVAPRPLVRLLERCPGIDQVFAAGTELPAFDTHAPLLDLPSLLRTTLANLPREVPYLFADPVAVERWRSTLEGGPGFRVGVAWQGNPRYGLDHQRSFPLARLAPVAELPGVRLISLQKGAGIEQLQEVSSRFAIEEPGAPGDDALGDFLETSAVVKNLDLVISPDMAYAHLAGGLGVRVFVVLPAVAEWRWLRRRTDNPWYPSARLFRQPSAGDWEAVFENVARVLRAEFHGGDSITAERVR